MAKKKSNGEDDDSSNPEYDVLVGFVHEFKFISEDDLSRMHGHPIEGRVYRILKDPYGFRIHIGRDNNQDGLDGLFLGLTLIGEQRRYSFNIEVVTPTNYLKLPLVEEDRVKVLDWLKSGSTDLWEGLKKDKNGDQPVIRTAEDVIKLITKGSHRAINIQEPTIKASASQPERERALEAALTLMVHFKSKDTNELVALFDAMYDRILNKLAN